MKRLLLLLALTASLAATAQQDLGHFSGLRSQGPIPADLRKNLEELYTEDKQRVRDYNDGRLANRDQVLRQSYFINRLTTNGRILYGDPITRMVEAIADTLLVDYPELRSELRFYSLKNATANAFTTGQGMIFVNLGLVAQCETEAQLAYVISHEIVHYYRRHNAEELARKKANPKDRNDQLAAFLRRHNRSFEMEHEADSLGLVLFYLPSPYYKQVADGVFDVLQFAQLPFDEVPFDTTTFNTPYYKLPSQYFLDKVGAITIDDNTDDSQSTHPNIRKRRARVGEMLIGHHGGSHFVTVSQQEFLYLRDLARMECIRQQLIDNEPVDAYYNSMVMLRSHPGNAFLLDAQAQALYTIARTMCKGGRIDNANKHQGEIHQLYHLFSHLSPAEACFVALHQAWTAHQALPDNAHLLGLCRSLAGTIHDECHHVRPDFSATFDTVPAADQAASAGKYAHIRRKNSSSATNPARYAFTDLMQSDPSFVTFLDSSLVAQRKDTAAAEGKVFLFDPFYGVYDNANDEIRYRRSAALEEDLVGYVPQIARGLGIDIVDFSDPALRSHDDDLFYNDFVTLVEWTTEYLSRQDIPNNRLFTQPGMDAMSARYDAHLLSINNVLNVEYSGIFTSDETYTHNRVIDTKAAQTLVSRTQSYWWKNSRNLINNEIHTTLQRAQGYKGPSGYFGRRMGVTAGVAVDFPLFNEPFERHPGKTVDLRPALGVEYVVKEDRSVALSFDYNGTQFDCSRDPLAHADILSLSLTYRFYSRTPAPMGRYVGVGLIGNRVALQPADPAATFTYLQPSYYRGGIQCELGRNIMVGTRMYLNYGTRFNLTVANFSEPFERWYDDSLVAVRKMNANLWMANILMFHINLGFLPF